MGIVRNFWLYKLYVDEKYKIHDLWYFDFLVYLHLIDFHMLLSIKAIFGQGYLFIHYVIFYYFYG